MNEKVLRQIIRESLVGLTESVKEKAVSKSQQRFFGMVDAYKKGELDDASKAVKDAAEGMSMKQVKDFAKTKHKGLPNHVDESVLRSIIRETLEQTWADREPKDEMDNIRLQRYQGLVEIVEYYLNQCEDGNGVELSDKQREQLEDACNKLCVFGEIGEKWANLGRSILSGNEDVAEEKPFTDENVYTMDDWRRDGSLKVQIGQLIAPEVYWQLRDSVPPMSDGGCFQPGEAYDHDWRTGKALYQTFTREGDNYYRYKGLQPASRWGLEESELKKTIRETVQTHLVNVLGKYTQGKTSSKEANKAIMDLANSSNTNLNESFKSRIIKNFADKYGIGYADPALSEITDDMIFNSDIVTEYPGWAVKDPKNYLVYKGKNDVWLILGVNQNFKDNFDYDYFDWGSRKPYPKDKSDELKRRRTKWDGQQGVKRDDGKYNYVYHSKMNNNHFLKNYTNKDFSNDMYWKKELG